MIDIPSSALALTASQELPADCHPARLYLARLSVSSRRTMTQALHSLAGLLTDGEATAFTMNWAALHEQDIAALRTRLAERYTTTAANKMLSALGGVLHEAHLLGQMAEVAYHSAVDVMRIPAQTPPHGSARVASKHAAPPEDAAQTPQRRPQHRP